MIKKIFFFLLLSLSLTSFADRAFELEARAELIKALNSSEEADKYHEKLNENKLNKNKVSSSAVLIAYQGMSKLMLAHHSYNPYKKLKHFLSGKDFIEKAITKDPNSIEVRYLRFCVQRNAPGILGYKDNISEDRKILLSYLKNYKSETDADLVRIISEYFKKQELKNSSEEENLLFNKAYKWAKSK